MRFAAPLAGVLTGIRMATKSLEPSLMPRSAVDQGLIMAGSFATGFIAGSASSAVVGLLPTVGGSAILRLGGVAVTGASTAHSLRDFGHKPPVPLDPASAWTESGADVLAGVAVAGLPMSDRSALGAIGTIAFAASTLGDARAALQSRDDNPDAQYLATATGTAVGIVAAVGGLGAVVGGAGHVLRRATGTRGLTGAVVFVAGAGAVAGILVGAGRLAIGRVIGSIERGNKAFEISYQNPPKGANVTGGTYSIIPFSTLGLQGRRLVSVATPVDVIESAMGEDSCRDPIRVFVGVDSAESLDERVELAIQELRRTGGFDRSTIIAASPAGTGYVNYIMVEAAELMSRGDVATVAIQYGSLPSMLSMGKVDTASDLYAKLITRLRAEIDALDRDIRLFAYGESLGALTAQNGVELLWDGSELPVDGALWVGTPSGTALFEALTSESNVPVFDRPEQLEAYVESGQGAPPATFLNHDNDPVASFTPETFATMPEWLKESDRGRGVNPMQKWLPGVAFWQGLIDTKNAATVVPGNFESSGHDYRADLATFIRIAFGFDDVTTAQMENIEERLRSSEINRAEQISRGKVQTA